MLRLLSIVLAISGAVAQPTAPAPSPGFPTCYICGNSSYVITNPNANVTFQGQDPVTCGSLNIGGLTGFIDPAYCPVVRTTKGIKACGCVISGAAPVAPSAPSPTPAPVAVPCNVCGQKLFRVFQPDVQVSLPGATSKISCGDLETQALAGGIDPNSCLGLVALGVPSECDCKLCKDSLLPVPVDPLSTNKTCLWVAGHYDQKIKSSSALTVDASLFGEQTWGEYLCQDLMLHYTAFDLCRVTCGSCDPHCADDSTGKTFNAGKFGQQTCQWLSANRRNYNKYCNQGTKPAAALCPFTCSTCP